MTPRRLILLMTGLVLLLAVGTFTAIACRQRAADLRLAQARAADGAAMLAEHAGRLLDAATLTLDQAETLTQGRDWAEVASSLADHQQLQALVKRFDFMRALWLTDETGMPRQTSRIFPAPPIDTSDREYFIQAKAGIELPLLSSMIRSRLDSRFNLVLARRIADEGRGFRGIAQAVLEPGYFFDFYEELVIGPALEIMLVRHDRVLALRFPQVEPLPDQLLRAAPLMPPTGGPTTYRSPVDGVVRIGAVSAVRSMPVEVVVGLSRDAVLATWLWALLPQAVFVAGCMVVVVGLAASALRLVAQEERLAVELEHRVMARTSDLARAVESRDLLLREVNHRIKNNLQLVSSLLNLERGRMTNDDAQDLIDAAQARIRSIAAVHDNLNAREGFDGVLIPEYLRGLCHELASSIWGEADTASLALEADAVTLPTDQAVSLGLIINELVTNSAKHAYGPGGRGPVQVSVRAQDNVLVAVVQDRGRGLSTTADASSAAGIGMKLVRGLAHQLRGTFTIEDAAPGARFVLRMPLRVVDVGRDIVP